MDEAVCFLHNEIVEHWPSISVIDVEEHTEEQKRT